MRMEDICNEVKNVKFPDVSAAMVGKEMISLSLSTTFAVNKQKVMFL